MIYLRCSKLRGWKIGIFINCYSMEGTKNSECVHVFLIHKDNIDKFRPSSAVFTQSVLIKDLNWNKKTYEEQVFNWNCNDMLKHISYHPVIAYVQDYHGFEFIEFKIPILLEYFKLRIVEFFRNIKHIYSRRISDIRLKRFMKKRNGGK